MDLDAVMDAAVDVVGDDDLAHVASALARYMGAERSLVFHYAEEGFPSFLDSDLASEMRRGYGPRHLDEDPIHPWMRSLTPRLVTTTESLDRSAFERSFAYRDFYRRAGVERLMGVWLTERRYGQPGMLGILLTKRGAPFDHARAERLEAARRPLRAIARRLETTRALREETDVLAALVARGRHEHDVLLDAAGRVRFCGARAEAVLSRSAMSALSAAARDAVRAEGPGAADALPVQIGPSVTACLVTLRGLAGGPWVCASVRPVELAAPSLTPAELRVLKRLAATGASNAELGKDLGVTTETVRTHIKRILGKLGARNRTQAIARARAHGILLS
ncbi:MAG TPA: hypothetical protein DEF51_01445 [Myxococcales bacterium]|nr:hypothetical protein [Myxococcales bacterium]